MLRAQYDKRGSVPQAHIEATEFEKPTLEKGQVLVEVIASPISPFRNVTVKGFWLAKWL